MGGAAIAQPFFGWIMDLFWQGQMHNHVRVYPIEAYQAAMWILPVAFAVALYMAFKLKETNCKPVD